MVQRVRADIVAGVVCVVARAGMRGRECYEHAENSECSEYRERVSVVVAVIVVRLGQVVEGGEAVRLRS